MTSAFEIHTHMKVSFAFDFYCSENAQNNFICSYEYHRRIQSEETSSSRKFITCSGEFQLWRFQTEETSSPGGFITCSTEIQLWRIPAQKTSSLQEFLLRRIRGQEITSSGRLQKIRIQARCLPS